jgi:hypothetical protein
MIYLRVTFAEIQSGPTACNTMQMGYRGSDYKSKPPLQFCLWWDAQKALPAVFSDACVVAFILSQQKHDQAHVITELQKKCQLILVHINNNQFQP